MKKIGLLILYLITSSIAIAYENADKWETHLSYSNTNRVCVTENKVFATASNHLYSISKEDKLLEIHTKLDGFSENEVTEIQYSKERKCLIIVYTNSNIDILESDGTIYNIPDLYQKQISVNKTVHQITIDKEYAYLATGFGIVVVNLKKKEIANTYIIGPDATKVPVYGITIDEEYIYAISSDYIYKAKKENTNLLDYNNWQENKIPLNTSKNCNSLYKFSNSLFTIKSDSIVYMYNNGWKDFYTSAKYAKLSFSDDKMFISAASNGLICYNNNLSEEYIKAIYSLDATYENNTFWIASSDCVSFYDNNGNIERFKTSGPALSNAQTLKFSGDRMYIMNGRGSKTDRGYKTPYISFYKDNKWTTYTPTQLGMYDFIDYAYDVTSVVTDPKDKSHYYFSTFGEGVFEVKNDKIIAIHNHATTNNQIKTANEGNFHYNRCDGLNIDSYGNIYVAMSSVNNPITLLSPSIGWKNLEHKDTYRTEWAHKFIFTSKFRALLSTRSSSEIYFWHDNKTPTDPSDDKVVRYTALYWLDKDGKSISPTYLSDAQEDKNGTIWIGTDMGPILLQDPSKIFTSNDYRCTRVKINRDDDSGLADYLLDGETVFAIEVDYGNRKWLGTASSGLYLVSEDGTETLAHFTKDNSPLSSNNISDLELNPHTGELFIATPEGVFSYHTDSTEPVKEATKETVYAYPNPVRPEFSGDVIIGGLEDNSLVWITDISGNLIFKGRTVGGSLSWNCKNNKGEDVTGGVYLVLVSNENDDNLNSVATKILVVR
jgi:ligand-binding sensor domain-containing protein